LEPNRKLRTISAVITKIRAAFLTQPPIVPKNRIVNLRRRQNIEGS